MWRWRKKKTQVRRRRASTSVTKHYLEHKEQARELVLERLAYFNVHYGLEWKRVAIRNQRRCWGSCSSLKNLNFNYKILFLPAHLRDYIVVHEMCHLVVLNHGESFWQLVAEQVPDYEKFVAELRLIDKQGHSVVNMLQWQSNYLPDMENLGTEDLTLPDDILSDCQSCGREVVCSCSK